MGYLVKSIRGMVDASQPAGIIDAQIRRAIVAVDPGSVKAWAERHPEYLEKTGDWDWQSAQEHYQDALFLAVWDAIGKE